MVNCRVVQVVRALGGVEGLNPAYRYSIFQRKIAAVASLLRSNYVDCQEYSGLKSSPFLSIALRIVSTLCIHATKATFFSFPAASNRS